MKNNFDLKKSYENFEKSFENFQTVNNISKPYSTASQAGILGLFGRCCDFSYIFMKNFLEYQGYFLPVTSSPKMVMENACDCGIIEESGLWLDILETRNTLAHMYDEEKALAAVKKILSEYIPAFEKLKQGIDENWLNA